MLLSSGFVSARLVGVTGLPSSCFASWILDIASWHTVLCDCGCVGGGGGWAGARRAVSAAMVLSRRKGVDPLVAGSQPRLTCKDG